MLLQVAKKEFTCSKCGEPIPKGTRYWSRMTDSTEHGYYNEHVDCFDYMNKLDEYLKNNRK